MAIGPRLEVRHAQTLVMTPQLRQAIRLLQFSHAEVAAFVEEELERNPLLDRDERSDLLVERPAPDQRVPAAVGEADLAAFLRDGTLPAPDAAPLDAAEADLHEPGSPSEEAVYAGTARMAGSGAQDPAGEYDQPAAGLSLHDHLAAQLRLNIRDPAERRIGAHLLACLDETGRAPVADAALAEALGVDTARVAAVRARMMRFDPVGVLAPDLATCLAAQLAERDRLDPAMRALLDHLELLARRDFRQLRLVCGVDAEDLAEMADEIRALDPKPGAGWDAPPPRSVIPDVLMRRAADGGWTLEMNPETLPRVLIREGFHARIALDARGETRSFLAERLASAQWLVRSLQQRSQTILKVASEIMRRQDGFLRHGVSQMRPLILRDIADAVELHESTVSRVTANKYIATPRGIFELKYFFTTAIAGLSGESHSAEAVRQRIRAMVDAESHALVLSDDAIVEALRREGVDIARRTVAKYRDALRIPSSVERRRLKAVAC